MIDYINVPRNETSIWVFYSNSSGVTTTTNWQTWQKPRNAKFVSFFVIGGGAGGGGGLFGAGLARTGGGGGASSSTTRAVFPANLLPDILYINVGLGGAGGASGENGTAGSISYVSARPDIAITNVILASAAVAPAAGSTLGLGGTVGSVFAQTAGLLSYLGIVNASVGIAGAAGGANTGGGGNSITIQNIVGGGAGGGGSSTTNTNGTGGNITASVVTQQLTGGAAGGTNKGNEGIFTQLPSLHSFDNTPMLFTGGAGGGANGTGTGGAGGSGSYGSGGGGGGAGTIGGAGGKGGNGIIIITTW